MKTSLGMMVAMCSTGALFGCASSQKAMEPRIVPTMKVHHSQESADGYYALGRYYHGARRFDEAVKAYQSALTLEPGHMKARNAMAILYAERGEYERAVSVLQELADAAPKSGYLLSNLGYAYFLKGDYEKAMAFLEKAVVLEPDNVRAWTNLGSVLERLGHNERARIAFVRGKAATAGKARQPVSEISVSTSREEVEGTQASEGHNVRRAPDAAGVVVGNAIKEIQSDIGNRTEVKLIGASVYEIRQSKGMPHIPLSANSSKSEAVRENVAVAQGLVRIEVSNGNGINGMAKAVGKLIGNQSMRVVKLTNQKGFNVKFTRIEYNEGFERNARLLAESLGQPSMLKQRIVPHSNIRLVLGMDRQDIKAIRAEYKNQFKLTEREFDKKG